MRAALLALALLLPNSQLTPVDRKHLCVTSGAIAALVTPKLKVTVPEMRAYVTHPTEQIVEAQFQYLGPAKPVHRSGSGEVLREFALKLRAQDGCNLVYAVWRIAPEQKAMILVKSNPGMTTSAECDEQGYTTVAWADMAPFQPGKRHTMRAEIKDTTSAGVTKSTLTLIIDGKPLLQGDVSTANFTGPVGVRTDNGQFTFELLAGNPVAGQTPPCNHGDEQ